MSIAVTGSEWTSGQGGATVAVVRGHLPTAVRRALLACATVTGASLGSCGSLTTRWPVATETYEAHAFGAPLFAAVNEDWQWLRGERGSCKTAGLWPIIVPFCLASLPVDLVGDLVLAPFDYIASRYGGTRLGRQLDGLPPASQDARGPG